MEIAVRKIQLILMVSGKIRGFAHGYVSLPEGLASDLVVWNFEEHSFSVTFRKGTKPEAENRAFD